PVGAHDPQLLAQRSARTVGDVAPERDPLAVGRPDRRAIFHRRRFTAEVDARVGNRVDQVQVDRYTIAVDALFIHDELHGARSPDSRFAGLRGMEALVAALQVVDADADEIGREIGDPLAIVGPTRLEAELLAVAEDRRRLAAGNVHDVEPRR